jgi:hypothetical protein
MEALSERIHRAIDLTRQVIPGYFEKTLVERAAASGQALGSVYEEYTPEQLETVLRSATWTPYQHPALAPGCEAFRASLSGRLGIIPLTDLPPDTVVTLDDRKGTGKISAIVNGVRGQRVDFTVLILGPEQGHEVVFTFHPGDPVVPSQVQTAPGLHKKQITVSDAIALGLVTAKIQ